MKAAKTLVWVMTGMLVALLGVLVVGLSLGWHKEEPEAAQPSSGNTPERQIEFGVDDISLGEPAGTQVDSITPIGGFVGLSLSGGGQAARVVIIDPTTGAIVARIQVEQDPGGALDP